MTQHDLLRFVCEKLKEEGIGSKFTDNFTYNTFINRSITDVLLVDDLWVIFIAESKLQVYEFMTPQLRVLISNPDCIDLVLKKIKDERRNKARFR